MKIVRSTLAWLITLLIPVLLVFLGLRLMLTHAFLQLEYRMPGFPPDSYGFTLQDRVHWSEVSWDYMLNSADIGFLANQTLPDGSPLYNDRELSHMQDVKRVVRPALIIGYLAWAVVLGIAVWARWGGWWPGFLGGLRRGGWLTVALAAIAGVFAATSFWTFFTDFHGLFFSGDSWLFEYSDSLIRLFPLRFWEDAFLYGGVLALAGGLALGLGLRPGTGKGVITKNLTEN
jgi:integral membrane protein (TIGR01906 family)